MESTINSKSKTKLSTQNQESTKKENQNKLKPSTLLKKQETGNVLEDMNQKPKIVQFLNIADFSSYTESAVPIDEPLFEPLPSIIQFTDYEPLQIKDKVFRLRNKDKYARRVKIIPPDSRLFQVLPYYKTKSTKNNDDSSNKFLGSKVAPGMDIAFVVRFSPEAKIDYGFDLVIVTEREKFVVPIVATGKRAMIDFPDEISFGLCPVKYLSEKPIMIRNVGEKTTKWFLNLPSPFDANKTEGVLENGKSEQIIVTFYPMEEKEYKLEGNFSYDGLKSYFIGSGKSYSDKKVLLSTSNIQMDDAYIGLQTQQTLQIINRSSVKVDFQWRAFKTEKEEYDKKNKLRAQLDQEEAEEKMLLKEMANEFAADEYDLEEEEESDDEDKDEKALILKRQKKSEMMLTRKYKNIRKAIEDDLLLFQDDIFTIEPSKGSIWPNSELTVTVSFKPQAALNYSCTAFCNISCSEERLPLHLAGEGIGPKAVITPQDDIDIGDITITAVKVKEFTIENRGEIECTFELLPNDRPFGKMFKFDIDKETLGVGERLNFTVTFQSDILGEFSETFRFKLEGSTELIPLRFKGHVIAPTFKFDPPFINFKDVSITFPHKEQIKLINTSPVSFRFNLSIPEDGKVDKEFIIQPARDVINKEEERVITISFTSQRVKKYEMVLVVDIENVGQGIHSIPIYAESFVPNVSLRPSDKIDFKTIPLRHAKEETLELINESHLPARFEVKPQAEDSKILAIVSTDRDRGEIPGKSSLRLTVTLTTQRLGPINMPLAINIVGHSSLPKTVQIQAFSQGPRVHIAEKEVDFGPVPVLKDWIKPIKITNGWDIPADFHVFTKNRNSIFKPLTNHSILEPNESMEIQVVCTADDVGKFQDTLHFVIEEGLDIDVVLKAKGTGSTIYCKDDLTNISFGLVNTFRSITKDIFVENKGRKTQKLQWVPIKKEKKKNPIKDDKEKKIEPQAEDEPEPTFTIVPDTISLPAKTGVMFQFRANSTKPGKITEQFQLTAQSGNERKANALYTSTLEGDFVKPSLTFSQNKLYFKYSWEKNVPFMPISKTLELTCASSLPTNFMVKTQPPFSINKDSFALEVGKSATLKVDFDPGQKYDKISGQTNCKLQFIHLDHPQRDYVDLVGEVCFPNLKLETNVVNFGSILSDTSKKIVMTIQNISEMKLTYEWNFADEEVVRERPTFDIDEKKKDRKKDRDIIPINEIFDILPMNGTLAPGETERVEFVFNALLAQKVKTSAVCVVEGGPDYEVTLVGDSSQMDYRLSTELLDYGTLPFNEWETKEIIIENTGKVTFEYKVDLTTIERKGLVDISPLTGSIKGNGKEKLTVRMCPGIPEDVDEYFLVEVAHFEPRKIKVKSKAIYPGIGILLPREENPDYLKYIDADKIGLNASADTHLNTDISKEIQSISEAEIEADRKLFCDYIFKSLSENHGTFNEIPDTDMNKSKKSPSRDDFNFSEDTKYQTFGKVAFKTINGRHLDPKIYERVILASYVCDLGNIVLGASKKRTIKIQNTSITQISFQFDQRVYKALGLTISPDKFTKVNPGEAVTINISYQTKKNLKFGKNKLIIPIEVKGGPKYNLDVVANLTIPEITLESDLVDFNKVLIGQRKTMFVRFENSKEVVCKWSMSTRAELAGPSDREGNKFSMNPTSGVILPGRRQLVEFTFIPTGEKAYQNKFVINIDDNPKTLVINVKGNGSTVALEFVPEKIVIGPILPYDNKALARVDIKNNSEYDTELYSLNFDQKYLLDEEMIKNYDELNTTDSLFFPVRNPGEPLWEKIKKANDIKIRRGEFEKRMKDLLALPDASAEAKAALQKEIDDFNAAHQEEREIIYPRKVDPKLKVHVVIFGPPGCGKTQLAKGLSKKHQRAVVNCDELLQWNIEHKTEAGEKATKFLEKLKKDFDDQLAAEKAKKKGAKKDEGPTVYPPEIEQLSEELLAELIRERSLSPDCNAGIIFDNLTSNKNYANERIIFRAILKGLEDQKVHIVNLYYPVDQSGLEVSEIIDPNKILGVTVLKETSVIAASPSATLTGKKGEKKDMQKDKSPTNKKSQAILKGKPSEKKLNESVKSEVSLGDAESPLIEKPPLFEINYPKQLTAEEIALWRSKAKDLFDIALGQYKEPPPVTEEDKKDDKNKDKKGGKPDAKAPAKKDAKAPVITEEPKPVVIEPPKINVDPKVTLEKDNKFITDLPIIFNHQQLTNSVADFVPEPIFPDPEKEPVPEPLIHQIVRRPNPRNKTDPNTNFRIHTPKGAYINETEGDIISLEKALEESTDTNITRWIIPSKKKISLYVRFTTKVPGQIDWALDFEAFFSTKKYQIPITGVCDYPSINSNPMNMFMQRKKVRAPNPPESYVSKHYIFSENAFEFGPLLVGKNPSKRTESNAINANSTVFRLTNNGKFDAEIKFALASSVFEPPEYKKGVFIVEPEEINLKVEQTEEIRIWSFPDEVKKFKDDLICMIKNNPLPVIVRLQTEGVKPFVKVENFNVQFDRLIIDSVSTQEIKVTNECSIPVKWKLNGLNNLEEEFVFQNTSGVLKPTQETIIKVTFTAKNEKKFAKVFELEVEDNEGIGVKQEPMIKINLQAEAFKVDCKPEFDKSNPEQILDFENVRVGETKEKSLPIRNNGIYDVKYRFVMKKKLFKDNFTIEPAEGIIAPKEVKTVVFKFKSKEEFNKFKTNNQNNKTDIILEILEGKSQEKTNEFPINVAVNSVFSKYGINPQKNINFGPIQFNESRTRIFEIKNEGIFDFDFVIFDYADDKKRQEIKEQEEADKAAIESLKDAAKDNKKAPPKKETKPPPKKDSKKGEQINGLKIGQFIINPPAGQVLKNNGTQTIEVTFQGSQQQLYEQKIGIHISGRDPNDQPLGVTYDLVGESCVPGINNENFESIFEEQIVIPSLSNSQNIQEQVNSNVFSIEEKTFYFGTLVPSKNPKGAKERFKISNPGKIPCTVKCAIKKRVGSNNEIAGIFDVEPKEVKIQPHDYTYVKVTFKPTIMASYGAQFEALVENGDDKKKGKLTFDLRGEGALPTLKIEKPKDFDGIAFIQKFPKTRVGRSQILPIVLKNDGQIPATAQFDLGPNDSFRFVDESSFTLTPKTYHTFNIEFLPREPGVKQWTIGLNTILNPYENSKIQISGEGYQEDIVFEGLPESLEDEIKFGDCVIDVEKHLAFDIRNNSTNIMKFTWNLPNEDFVMIPKSGHINARSSKTITCVFKSQKANIYKDVQLACLVQAIKRDGFKDWDDSMTNVRYVTKTEFNWIKEKKEEERRKKEEEEAKLKKGGKKPDPKAKKDSKQPEPEKMPPIDPNEEADCQLVEVIPEPEHQVIDKSDKTIILKGRATSDYARYECDVKDKQIYFKPTLMYTSRIFSFKLKNTSYIQMKFKCKIANPNTGVLDAGYYSVTPKNDTIDPNCDAIINVKFSPKEVDDSNARLLIINIDNVDPNLPPDQRFLTIELDGETERPICHFELPPPALKEKKAQDLATKYHVIEFQSLGTKIKNVKRFYVVNPTNQGYEFEWTKDNEEPGKNTNSNFFKCLTPKGVILSGKKYEMVFEYTPDLLGDHESFWSFMIPSEKISHRFALLGNVVEPNVFLDRGSINFGPLLLGGKNKETIKLKNLEHIPFPFNFDKESIKGDSEYGNSISVTPISGVVNADSEIPIEVTFHPQYELDKEYNYNLQLVIKQKSRPINLNVKGIGYNLHHMVALDSAPTTPISSSIEHILDFGDIFINEKKYKTIIIHNSGSFNFDFTVKKSPFNFITITPESDTVMKNEGEKGDSNRSVINVSFTPIAEYKLKPKIHFFTLNIVSGPSYNFRLAGSARKPNIEFSFLEYDFGPCYVLKQPLHRVQYLELKNSDNSAISIDSFFEKTNYLDVQLSPGQVILPQVKGKDNTLKVPIIFTPRELTKYEETVTFDINGLHKIELKIRGEGVPLKLDLEKSEYSIVDFGIARANQEISKSVRLINYGRRAITISFNFDDQLKHLEEKYSVTIANTNPITLNPKEGTDIELSFKPNARLHQFKQELFYQIVDNKEVRRLLHMSGCCQGIELKVLEESISFDSVVVNSKVTKKAQVVNLGDLPAKFVWDTTFSKKFFTISPSSGIIPAHEDFYFEIIFHPDAVSNDIKFKVKCDIEDSEPFYMTFSGKCIGQAKENIQTLEFKCAVRETDKKSINITNPSTQPWKLKPQISANIESAKGYFNGKELLEVPAGKSAEYVVTYNPLSMTKNEVAQHIKEETHDASLFFATPDGSALMYNLVGRAGRPNPITVDKNDLKAKKSSRVDLVVKNWLKVTQRFNVTWDIVGDQGILVKGANTIDIMGEATKDYKLFVYCLKAGQGKVNVTFKNESTGEMIIYIINLTIGEAELLGKYELTSPVRESTSKVIIIENPLPKSVPISKEMIDRGKSDDILQFNLPSDTISPESEFGIEVLFRPLIEGKQTVPIIINHKELGLFKYELILIGTPSNVQRSMTFKAPLCSDIVQTFKFTNYLKRPTNYTVRVEKAGTKITTTNPKEKLPPAQVDFYPLLVQANTYPAPAADSYDGQECNIDIRYEPSNLGESRAVLIVSSPEGGEFTCNLIGQASSPVPKGPYKVSAKPTPIEFKNPFFEPTEFKIVIDNPAFTCGTKSPAKIDKKGIQIQVSYKAVQGYGSTGRLIVSYGDMPMGIYYLQGE